MSDYVTKYNMDYIFRSVVKSKEMKVSKSMGRIIERDGLFGGVLVTVGIRYFKSTSEISWVSFQAMRKAF